MTELLITIMNLPVTLQRLIAATTSVVVGASCVAGVWFACAFLSARYDSIDEGRKALGEVARIMEADEKLLQQPPPSLTASEFLEDDSDAANQAILQAKLNAFASANNASVISVGGVPPIELGGVRYVGVRGNIQGGMGAIADTLRAIETGKPFLVVRGLELRGGNSGLLTGPIKLSMLVTFYGAIRPAAHSPEQKAK